MAVQLLPIGVPTQMLQNVVYALPLRPCWVATVNAVEASVDGITWVSVLTTNSPDSVNLNFVRCTTANTMIICRSRCISG